MINRTTRNRLSLRCKFKDFKTVEVTVINHETNETYQILWSYMETRKPVKVSKELALEEPGEESSDEEESKEEE